jgi:thioredoxin-related protein
MSISRRSLLLAAAATGAARLAPAYADPILTADGLYREPWFLESFLDLRDDLQSTTKEGKRFAVMWGLKGCPYCKETHFVNFAQPRIADYIKANFEITQLNIIGSLPVTDFDGEKLSEKALAAKYGVRFTPTFQFFSTDLAAIKSLPPRKREVARAPGYLRPNDFLAMFRFVREKAYEKGSFRDFLEKQQPT